MRNRNYDELKRILIQKVNTRQAEPYVIGDLIYLALNNMRNGGIGNIDDYIFNLGIGNKLIENAIRFYIREGKNDQPPRNYRAECLKFALALAQKLSPAMMVGRYARIWQDLERINATDEESDLIRQLKDLASGMKL